MPTTYLTDEAEDDPNTYYENGRMVRMHYPAEYHPLAAQPSEAPKYSEQPRQSKLVAPLDEGKDSRYFPRDDGQPKLADLPMWPNPKSPLYGMVKNPDPTAAFN